MVKTEGSDPKVVQEDISDMYASSAADVERRISRLLTEYTTTHTIAQSGMIHASQALIELKAVRKSRSPRRAGAGIEKLLSNIGIFLQGFSGIAEILKSVDQQFGGLAYGTVSVLATVAVKKAERDELIEEVLEELAHAFPRLNILEHIEPRDSLRSLMIGAFDLTIRFCRQTTEYCTGRSLRRMKEASIKNELLKTVSRLRIRLSEIHKECEIIMIHDLKEIRNTLDVMKMKLNNAALEISETKIRLQEVQARGREVHAIGEDTNNRVREGQAWMERQERTKAQKAHLSEIRKSLDLKDIVKTVDAISIVKSLLRRLSENQEQKGKSAKQLTLEMLKANKIFLEWHERSQSSMLILGGHNFVRGNEHDSEDDSEMSWLSYASAWLAEESIRKPGRTLSYFGHLNYTVRKQHRRSFWHVIKTFIYQLAQTLSEESIDVFDKIISDVDPTTWDDADSADMIEQMVDIIVALLELQEEDSSVCIVIDRLDQCQWERFKEKGIDGLGHAVRFLLQLVRHQSLKHLSIKVLLVVNNRAALEAVKKQKWAEEFLSITNWYQEADE